MDEHRENFTGTAADLRPGDLVVDAATGQRQFAAFDRFVGEDTVTVWTAVADQDRGVDRLLELDTDTALAISRKAGR